MNDCSLLPGLIQQRWTAWAACRGRIDLYFAPHAERPPARIRREAKARRICQSCPVIFECRNHARRHVEYGFWGGESEDERAASGFSVPTPVRRRGETATG